MSYTKLYIFRLQNILPKIISEYLGAFIKGQRTNDHIIIAAQEVIDNMHNRNKKKKKLDINEKA